MAILFINSTYKSVLVLAKTCLAFLAPTEGADLVKERLVGLYPS